MRQLKWLSLLGLLLLGPSTYAQSVRYQSQAISSRGAGIANATIAVCTQPANTNTQPCSPLATLATSTSTTSGGANPLTADSFGNFFFYAAPGRYTVQIYGPAVSGQFVIPDTVISCDLTGPCTTSGTSTFNGQFTSTAPCAIGQILYVEASGCYTTIDQAVAAVPSFIVVASSCTESSFTVTCSTSVAHGLTSPQQVYISGNSVIGYDGFYGTISGTTGTTIKYTANVSGLGTGGGGLAAPLAHIVIPPNYVGVEAATCASVDGIQQSLTPANITIEDHRGTSLCGYNVAYNSGQEGARPTRLSFWQFVTNPQSTTSAVLVTNQITGTIPTNASMAGLTSEVDITGAVVPSTSAVLGGEFYTAVRSTGGTFNSVRGVTASVNFDRTPSTTNVLVAASMFAQTCTNSSSTATIQDCYSLYADIPSAATRNNMSIYSPGNILVGNGNGIYAADNVGNTPGTGHKLLTFGGVSGIPLTYTSPLGSQGEPMAFVNVAGTKTNWLIGAQFNVNNGFEITPSTAVGGTTFTTPVLSCSTTNCSSGAAGVFTDVGGLLYARIIASGTSTLTSNATLGSGTCQTAITTAAAGVATTDSIEWSFATAPATGDAISPVASYVTSGNVNFTRCNPTAAAQNVTAIVINWRVVR